MAIDARITEGEAVLLEGSHLPDRASFKFIQHEDVRLRVLVLYPQTDAPRGSIILVPGRTEFIEKYLETAEDFRGRGFTVLINDHRGQGLSDRLLDDPLRSWVRRYQDYVEDLEYIVKVLDTDLPRPHILVGHSMGGCIGLQGLISGRLKPDAAVFNAPMLGVFGLESSPMVRLVVLLSVLGFSHRTLPFQPQPKAIIVPFEKNKLTSDKGRYARWRQFFDTVPRLRVGGPTFGWIRASLKSMRYVNKNAAKLKTPTLIVATSMDPIVSPESVQAFAKNSGSEFLMIKGALHETFLEKDEYRKVFFDRFDVFCESQGL